MNTIYQLPPILSGSADQKTQQLRDYLVRIVQQLPTEAQVQQAVAASASQTASVQRAGRNVDARIEKAVQEQAVALKALIVKTANAIEEEIGELSDTYVARSDFGVFQEATERTLEEQGSRITDAYARVSSVETSQEKLVETINGEIIRGFISLPGGDVFGIAVAENIVTTGSTQTVNEIEYQEIDIDRMQALGLYTATGWQFWLNGQKAGWFDAQDGLMHVPNIVVESTALFGDDWLVSAANGWGIRYIGG